MPWSLRLFAHPEANRLTVTIMHQAAAVPEAAIPRRLEVPVVARRAGVVPAVATVAAVVAVPAAVTAPVASAEGLVN